MQHEAHPSKHKLNENLWFKTVLLSTNPLSGSWSRQESCNASKYDSHSAKRCDKEGLQIQQGSIHRTLLLGVDDA